LNLETATVEEFEPLVGDPFRLDSGEAGSLDLELTAATPASNQGPEGTRHPFALAFRGPLDPLLPQGIYRLEHQGVGPLEIFIVPVGRDESGTEYEAVFN
jgi:hypothetical protein